MSRSPVTGLAARRARPKQSPTTAAGLDGYTASFVGMAPMEDPQYVVLVNVQRPKGNIYGISTAPVFNNIMSRALVPAQRVLRSCGQQGEHRNAPKGLYLLPHFHGLLELTLSACAAVLLSDHAPEARAGCGEVVL